jgi:hypothetical protein
LQHKCATQRKIIVLLQPGTKNITKKSGSIELFSKPRLH